MKRLVICADGTWNVRDQVDRLTGKRHPTNVTKLARSVRPRSKSGTDQVVYYHDGIGTGTVADRVTGGAFGRGMERNIRDLYRFIVYNFEPGDEIFLFGFSRGAFTVRSLAGFMNMVGLIEKDDDYYVPEIYACYETGKGPGTPEWKAAFRNVHGTRPCPPIRLIGVWDTVGALGAPGLLGQLFNKKKYEYHDVGLNPNIHFAVHALAIDERRKPFLPTFWTRPNGWNGHLVQAWFAGVHSNIGGGYDPDGLANEALHWMAEHAELQGLDLDATYLAHFRPCFNSTLRDSMSPLYRMMGPVKRALGDHALDGEGVHQSAIDRKNLALCAYGPKNLTAEVLNGTIPVVNTARIPRGTPCA
jgi:uncharacterized protein (DUF2235 family)